MADFSNGAADTLSKAGAQALALRIERFWHAKGHPGVTTRIEPVEVGGPLILYGVRSNLVAGHPPR